MTKWHLSYWSRSKLIHENHLRFGHQSTHSFTYDGGCGEFIATITRKLVLKEPTLGFRCKQTHVKVLVTIYVPNLKQIHPELWTLQLSYTTQNAHVLECEILHVLYVNDATDVTARMMKLNEKFGARSAQLSRAWLSNYIPQNTPCLLTRIREFIHTQHRNTTRHRRPSVLLRC